MGFATPIRVSRLNSKLFTAPLLIPPLASFLAARDSPYKPETDLSAFLLQRCGVWIRILKVIFRPLNELIKNNSFRRKNPNKF